MGNAGTHFEKTRGARIRSRLRIVNAHDEQKRLKLRRIGYFAKIQKPYCGTYTQWRSAYKRGGRSLRSRFKSIRHCAILLEETPAVLSLGKLCEDHRYSYEWVSGQNTTVDQRGEDNCMQNEIPSCLSSFQGYLQFWKQFVVNIDIAGFVSNKSSPRAKWRTSSTRVVQITLKIHNNGEKRDDNRDSDDRLRDLPWMVGGVNRIWRTQKCTRTHFSGLRFGTSYESDIKIKEALYLYSLPKRPKWRSLHANQHDKGSLQKTHWRSSTSSRKVWWLDNGWSQSPRWGMWIKRQSPVRCRGSRSCHSMDSVLCVHKTSQETEESSRKFLEQSQKPKVVYTDNSLDYGKACEDLSWNHCSSAPHRSETNGIAERAVRRVKEGTSAVLLRSGLDEEWWADSMECCTYLRNIQDLLSDGKTPYERRFGKPFKGPVIPFGSLVEYYPNFCEGPVKNPSFWKESLTWIVPWIRFVRGEEFGKETFWSETLRNWKRWRHRTSTQKDSMQRR